MIVFFIVLTLSTMLLGAEHQSLSLNGDVSKQKSMTDEPIYVQLERASYAGDIQLIEDILRDQLQNSKRPFVPDVGLSLTVASRTNNLEAIHLLRRYGVVPQACTSTHQIRMCPVRNALIYGNFDSAQELIDNGGLFYDDLDDHFDYSYLCAALKGGNPDCVSLILKSGITDEEKEQALTKAKLNLDEQKRINELNRHFPEKVLNLLSKKLQNWQKIVSLLENA